MIHSRSSPEKREKGEDSNGERNKEEKRRCRRNMKGSRGGGTFSRAEA